MLRYASRVAVTAAFALCASAAWAEQITIKVRNASGDSANVHVYDQFANGERDVNDDGHPFALAAGETTPDIKINADADSVGHDLVGHIKWECSPSGGSLSAVDVRDGQVIDACH